MQKWNGEDTLNPNCGRKQKREKMYLHDLMPCNDHNTEKKTAVGIEDNMMLCGS